MNTCRTCAPQIFDRGISVERQHCDRSIKTVRPQHQSLLEHPSTVFQVGLCSDSLGYHPSHLPAGTQIISYGTDNGLSMGAQFCTHKFSKQDQTVSFRYQLRPINGSRFIHRIDWSVFFLECTTKYSRDTSGFYHY